MEIRAYTELLARRRSGVVAERLEHIPNSDPSLVRIISDNPYYSLYECMVKTGTPSR